MYRPVGSTSAYSASSTSSPPPNTSILDQPQRANESTSKREGKRREKDQRDRRSRRRSARGCYALGAAAGEEEVAGAGRSVKGSENGAYDGRMRRQRRLRSDDVGFARPATPMARHPAEDTRQTQHLILPRSASSRRRTRNPWEGSSPPQRLQKRGGGGGAHGRIGARRGWARVGLRRIWRCGAEVCTGRRWGWWEATRNKREVGGGGEEKEGEKETVVRPGDVRFGWKREPLSLLVSFCRWKTKQDFRLNFKSLLNSR